MLNVQLKHSLTHFTLDVDFHVSNEIAVLFGPSGAGKTSILNSISGLLKIKDGTIQLNNRYFVKNGKTLVPVHKRKIGYVFQDYALFSHRTVWQNIKYGMKNEQMTMGLIKELGIEHLINKFPHQISGGEKQRTALIRALATEPELLLLDEPFSALDNRNKHQSYDQLLTIHQQWNMPIILVSHNEAEVNYLATKMLCIEEGKLVSVHD